MSSGFVPAGQSGAPPEATDAWEKAKAEIEENRQRRTAAEPGLQEGGKSLYEHLQANKAAKQEAFEEAAKLKNQFRNLEEDEVDFLDSVLESTRAKEAAVRKETTEQLEAFRKQREDADRALRDGEDVEKAGSPTEELESWSVGKKRRRKDKGPASGVKLRKSSSTQDQSQSAQTLSPDTTKTLPAFKELKKEKAGQELQPNSPDLAPKAASHPSAPPDSKKSQPSPNKPSVGLGLAGYSSDEDI